MALSKNIDVDRLERAAKKIKIISHPIRIEMIKLLEENEKLNVTELYERLRIQQAEASFHLNLLKNQAILKKVRAGKMSFYSVNNKNLEQIIKIVDQLNEIQ